MWQLFTSVPVLGASVVEKRVSIFVYPHFLCTSTANDVTSLAIYLAALCIVRLLSCLRIFGGHAYTSYVIKHCTHPGWINVPCIKFLIACGGPRTIPVLLHSRAYFCMGKNLIIMVSANPIWETLLLAVYYNIIIAKWSRYRQLQH